MVNPTRATTKAIPAKHLSPMRGTDSMSGKYGVSSSPADSFLRVSRLPVPAVSSNYSNNTISYKYNDMVMNNREKFNSLHFC